MTGSTLLLTAVALLALWPFGRNREKDTENTIESLEAVEVAVDTTAKIEGSEEKAMESYRVFLDLASDDPLLRAEAMRRLADLQLEAAEAEQLRLNLRELGGATDTIDLYEQLLDSYPGYAKNDLVLYQLSRAYEATGQVEESLATLDRLVREYPDGPHVDEAHFRRGETLFVAERYREAEAAYREVLAFGAQSNFYEQSLYKLGWSQFKQLRHEDGLDPFFSLLDRKFGDGIDPPASGAAGDPAGIYAAMGRAEQELIDDTLRVVAISFSYMSGPASVSQRFESHGARPYAYVVYANLGDFYLDQERFQDAADAYRAFVELDPYHAKAPHMQAEVIVALEQGGFADLVLAGKREFVERYGPSSPYWSAFSFEDEPEVVAHLKSNLTDLAAFHHAEAQQSGSREDYAQAARWYRTYLESFPDDENAADTNFLLAEVLFESESFADAAQEYERTAYEYPLHARSAEAGYAAILAFAEHEKTVDASSRPLWHRAGIDSALRFAATYPEHEQANAVAVDAAEKLFDLNDFVRAAEVGRSVVARVPAPEPALMRTAWTVVAHSEFDLENFAAAENAYLALRAYVPPDDAEYDDVVERIASSIYKQGEHAQAAGLLPEAVDHFLRVGATVPGAAVVPTAEYDAAAVLIELEDWTRASSVLEGFRNRYPDHELGGDVTAKLAVAYLESGQSAKAATEFERIADQDGDPAMRTEALWRAAELYSETGQTALASRAYANYVERYPQPVDTAVEARLRLADLSRVLGDEEARALWLTEIVAADASAGAERSDRTRYLAAKAQLELSAPVRDAFTVVRLVVPLEESLKAKRGLMEQALAAYGKAADYGVTEVTTAATYEIAELYHELSRALFDSERPPELNAAELSQYDILLEEQAFPLEEEAIDLHEVNARRTQEGVYDEWVAGSLEQLASLMPVRYAKHEMGESRVDTID
jgi:TolA-binding protein